MAPTFFKGREGKPLVEMDSISSFFSELLKGLEGDTTKNGKSKGKNPADIVRDVVSRMETASPEIIAADNESRAKRGIAPIVAQSTASALGGSDAGGSGGIAGMLADEKPSPVNSAKVLAGENTPQEGDTSDPTHGEIAALQQRIQDKDQIIESLRSQIETMQRALSQGPATPAPTKPVGDGALDPMAGLPEGRVAAPAPGALPGLGRRPELGGAGLAGGGGRPIDPRIALGLGG